MESSNSEPSASDARQAAERRPSDDVIRAFCSTVDRLFALASEDDQLRSSLQTLARAVLHVTNRGQPAATAAADTVDTAQHDAPASVVESPVAPAVSSNPSFTAPLEPPVPVSEALAGLTLGQSTPGPATEPPQHSAYRTDATTADLPVIEPRCRLKAKGARWAETRRRLVAQGAPFLTEIEPKDEDLIAQARSIDDCFLWMCHRSAPSPPDAGQYDTVAGCFEAAAEVIALIRQVQDDSELLREEFEQCLDLLAEAQSALRVGIDALGGRPDQDQKHIYFWLKRMAQENQIFIRRHMRMDDPADPNRWGDVIARAEALEERIQAKVKRVKDRRKLLKKVEYKAAQIAADPAAAEQWPSVAAIVDELIAGGLAPSNAELREMLVPIVDSWPESLAVPPNLELVRREIDRYLANCSAAETPGLSAPPSEATRQTARLLKGRSLVLIGGHRRHAAERALKSAFQLGDLYWVETRDHESVSSFEPFVARPDVAAVLLAIRWVSHSHKDVQAYCERYGKPLIYLPSGYNPNQVAEQIVKQASDRLNAA